MKHVRECVLLVLSAALAHGQVLQPGVALDDVALAGVPQRLGTVHLDSGSGTLLPFPTIQAAVDAASEGDTVLLSDGTFTGPGNRGIVVEGKNLTIRSRNGPERCIIDCEGAYRGFYFRGAGVTSQALLRGVTITRGNPAMSDEFGSGGAVLIGDVGGLRIEDCHILYNRGRVAGGVGAGSTSGIVELVDCRIVGNETWQGPGGGVVITKAVMDRCQIIGNRAATNGGGIMGVEGVIRNCLIADNRADDWKGGGLYFNISGDLLVSNCTIVDNFATGTGGGIHAAGDDFYENCILWGNRAPLGDQFYSADYFFCAHPTIAYCVVEQGDAGIDEVDPTCAPILIALQSGDPLFVDRALGDYRITAGSPCKDAGDPSFVPTLNEGDIENQPRLNGPVDIGSDELWPGLALSLPSPGRSGEQNEIRVSGASAGDLLGLFYGLVPGPLGFSFGACPGLTLGIADAVFLGHGYADAAGGASLSVLVEPAASGTEVWLQAIGFAPQQGAPCLVSNLVRFVYP